ncbi:type VI secretion system Vgr family protein [Paracoccus zhejiangensis]|uniref:Type VI secretion system tip protein VgrG n=1 Tax=Paracoccus zhejiangensis TaxID=1077935 RepID=A0A2H5F4R3_9RHOB|nr:type VI secretion system tip protein TssI/VgrG [Paracoccus zhejiangensis]AUH66536.1 type VI secretion system tip protein VgrG [Paracoccus zhejiangensis]
MSTERYATLQTPLAFEGSLASGNLADFRGLAFLSMRGHDMLSQCFEYDITAVSGSPDILANDLLGEEVTLTLGIDTGALGEPRIFHGIVDSFRFAGLASEGWLYHLVLRPKLWLLSKATNNRIFQEQTVREIVEFVLNQHQVSGYDWHLNGPLPKREYCVQYGESDLNFVQRLLEHEGIFYFFRFEEGKHTLILSDSVPLLKDTGADPIVLRYGHELPDTRSQGGQIVNFSRVDSVVSGSHLLTDYDFEKPSADLTAQYENALSHKNSAGKRYSYPGNYIEHGRGDLQAKIRNQQDQAHAFLITALSNYPDPASGSVVTVTEFPRAAENASFAVERVDYDIRGGRFRSLAWQQRGGERGGEGALTTLFRAEENAALGAGRFLSMQEFQAREAGDGGFSAIYRMVPSDHEYRPPRLTPRPAMKGLQTAVVVGPSGEEIYTDKYSRVKVQFHWDRLGGRNENSTCFIRVSSAWAGSGWGFIQIPRIGQEVIVDFLDGDPDQPIITGRVYNAEQMPPYALPGNATQSGWKSNSSPGGGGWNELRFEDKKGNEEVYFQAEKDHNELVKNNEARHIGNDFSEEVVHDATQWVGHDRTESVDNNKSTTVGVDRTVSIGNNDDETVGVNRSLTVGTNETISVGSNSTETIGANHSQTVGSNQTISIGIARTDTVGAAEVRTVGAAQTNTIGAERAVTVGAAQQHLIGADDSWTVADNQTINVGIDRSVTIGKNSSLTVGEASVISIGKSASESIGEDMAIKVGKDLIIEAGDSIILKCGSAAIAMKKDGTINIEGKDVTVTGSGKINVKADSDVTIKGSKINQN